VDYRTATDYLQILYLAGDCQVLMKHQVSESGAWHALSTIIDHKVKTIAQLVVFFGDHELIGWNLFQCIRRVSRYSNSSGEIYEISPQLSSEQGYTFRPVKPYTADIKFGQRSNHPKFLIMILACRIERYSCFQNLPIAKCVKKIWEDIELPLSDTLGGTLSRHNTDAPQFSTTIAVQVQDSENYRTRNLPGPEDYAVRSDCAGTRTKSRLIYEIPGAWKAQFLPISQSTHKITTYGTSLS
jgi:hypothetical protein